MRVRAFFWESLKGTSRFPTNELVLFFSFFFVFNHEDASTTGVRKQTGVGLFVYGFGGSCFPNADNYATEAQQVVLEVLLAENVLVLPSFLVAN